MNFKKCLISAAIVATALLGSAQSALAADVTVTVKDIRRLQGHLLVSIFTGKENYHKNVPVTANRVKVTKSEEVITFSDLPDGEYAVKLIHDDNDNNKLDTNILGIPKEGYGFSNNGGAFGPPAYKEAKFTVKDKTAISITLL